MQFKFVGRYMSGHLAFMGPPSRRRLLVADAGHGAVHIIDVVGKTHEGYVAPPGMLSGPRGVAAKGNLVAVSTKKHLYLGTPVIYVFKDNGMEWSVKRKIVVNQTNLGIVDETLHRPTGLRFTSDGTRLVVADELYDHVSMFRVDDGSFERHVVTQVLRPTDVQECEGGWLVSHSDGVTLFRQDSLGGVSGDIVGLQSWDGYMPRSLAMIPGLGVAIGDCKKKTMFIYFTYDAIAMERMSDARVQWMAAVARGTEARRRRAGVVRAEGSGGKRPRVQLHFMKPIRT